MKAAVLTESGFKIKELPIPSISSNDVLIRVKSVGICGTDIAIYKGTYKKNLPLILGHEFSGVIERVGPSVKNLAEGMRVTSEINIVCNHCYYCTHGMRTHCINRKAIGISRDGAMAEYVVVPAENIHIIPDSLSFDEATFIEPLAAAIETFEMAPLGKDDNIVIYGSGKMGLLIAQVAKIFGAKKVIVIGRTQWKLDLAKELGADVVINTKNEDVFSRVLEECNGVGCDYLVEATGNPEVVKDCFKLVRSRGVVSLKSTHGENVELNITDIVVRELRIQGSRCGPFEPAIKLLREKKVKVKPLISKIYPLEMVEEAFREAMSSDTIKVILHP
ncbi:MAG: zinc-dependent alcohol dehydrogenase [Candidatus Asgardarchaeia archaeon]